MAISPEAKMKAPIASAMETPTRLVARSAAPGVDQAVRIGARDHSERPMQLTAMPMPSAHSQEAISAVLAPAAWAAWKTMAAEAE